MTAQARAALERADVICGYTVYVDLVRALCPGKLIFATPMTQERERCAWALDRAAEGKTVAVVCSGDAGVYGMAGLLLQMAPAGKTRRWRSSQALRQHFRARRCSARRSGTTSV